MTPDAISTLYEQHAKLMTEISTVYVALAVAGFVGLIFVLCMFGLAAWSVRVISVQQRNLEGKFVLLIDVLLEGAHRDIQARQVAVTGERVEVTEEKHGTN